MSTEHLVHQLGDILQRTLDPISHIRNPYVPASLSSLVLSLPLLSRADSSLLQCGAGPYAVGTDDRRGAVWVGARGAGCRRV